MKHLLKEIYLNNTLKIVIYFKYLEQFNYVVECIPTLKFKKTCLRQNIPKEPFLQR